MPSPCFWVRNAIALDDVTQIVSMIGTYRDVLEEGERFKSRGMLEEIHDESKIWPRIVVGSGRSGEYIDWPG